MKLIKGITIFTVCLFIGQLRRAQYENGKAFQGIDNCSKLESYFI